uniref:Uncharacterized protein n=1 Tax=Ditylenchus dipsaci TaxID=166011 RepID=A0A915DI33_9BILA
MEATAVKAENVIKFSLLPPEIQLLTWVKNKNVGAIVRLYSHGAPGDAVDKNGDNLLHIAVKTGDLLVIQAVLMLYGRSHLLYSRTNNEGKRPSDLTFSVEILKCIEIIETGVLSIKNKRNKKSNSDSLSGSGRGDVKCDIDNQSTERTSKKF